VKGKWKSLKAAIVSVGGHCQLLLLLCAPLASSSAGHLTTKVFTSLMVAVGLRLIQILTRIEDFAEASGAAAVVLKLDLVPSSLLASDRLALCCSSLPFSQNA